MLAALFDWWILHGNEDMGPLNPRTRTYARYLRFFPDSPRPCGAELFIEETLAMFRGGADATTEEK